jgi:uncharacterized protein DUF2442
MVNVSSKDRQRYMRARGRGKARAHGSSALLNARYDPGRDFIELAFGGGASMSIPRKILHELEQAPASKMEPIVISPAGDALSWPSLDVHVHIPGLVERAFGFRLLVAPTERGRAIRS